MNGAEKGTCTHAVWKNRLAERKKKQLLPQPVDLGCYDGRPRIIGMNGSLANWNRKDSSFIVENAGAFHEN